ncbi:MAG TPA: hypothetical protein VGD86_02225 [Devosia sp.]|jgi:hypothetical protein
MSEDKPEDKPIGPWKLTPGRIVILILGVLLVLYTASALLGGLSNYQTLRDSALTPPAPAAPPRQ